MIIDAHQHFWKLSTGDYPWMTSDAMRPLRSDFGPDDLKPLMDEAAVDNTIVVQCRHDAEKTRDLLAIADTQDSIAGSVGWVDLLADDVAGQIEHLQAIPGGSRLVRIRHIAHDEPDAGWLKASR
ncbi:amidohydrolase family protein [Mesorhizobium sp. ORM8.1]